MLASLWLQCSCSGSSHHEDTTREEVGGQCRGIADMPASVLPHVTVPDEARAELLETFEAVLLAHDPALEAESYAAATVGCRNLQVMDDQGYRCDIDLTRASGELLEVHADDEARSEALYRALQASGAVACDDPHGSFLELRNLRLSESTSEFDDASVYDTYPEPDLRVSGAAAARIEDAFAAAGIDDCDAASKVFVVCQKITGPLACSFQRLDAEEKGAGNWLRFTCGPSSGLLTPGGELDADAGRALWDAIIAAGKESETRPLSGTWDQVSVINASWFAWHGGELGFLLTADNPTLPSP